MKTLEAARQSPLEAAVIAAVIAALSGGTSFVTASNAPHTEALELRQLEREIDKLSAERTRWELAMERKLSGLAADIRALSRDFGGGGGSFSASGFDFYIDEAPAAASSEMVEEAPEDEPDGE